MEKGEVLVKVTKSVTKNLGNYNSARVEYGLEKIVDVENEAQTTHELSEKIDAFLEDEILELTNANN